MNSTAKGTNLSDSKTHVLVVDDESELAEILCEALEMDGFKVTSFENSVMALAKASDLDFDVVISDHHMPGMSGEEFFHRLKSEIERPFLFYLCTGDMGIDSSEFEKAGGTKVVTKPYNIFELSSEIKEKP